jgi:bacitracin transport system permease protein
MSIRQLIIQNFKSNLKHYYLYVLALIFSVALYFAFVTLQYDPALNQIKGNMKGAASIRAASILLVAIVAVFNLYANNMFVKRRSKEIGLLQLIGMTKNTIFRILSAENCILYFSSLLVGTFIGFSASKLILMILFKLTGVTGIASLHFSTKALIQTLLVFTAIYLFIMLVNYTFIKRQSILSLFQFRVSTEDKVRDMSTTEVVIGAVGLLMILIGYYVSSMLFGGDFTTIVELFAAMTSILALVIIGTYLFYKGSVRLILHLFRKQKKGFLHVREVLSLSSIMFRMKSNALLLTVITTVSALAIALLALSYITYYSTEQTAKGNVPNHFFMSQPQYVERFTAQLDSKQIKHRETHIEVIQASVNISEILDTKLKSLLDQSQMKLAVIADTASGIADVAEDQAIFTGYNDMLQKLMTLKPSGRIEINGKQDKIELAYLGLKKDHPIGSYFTSGGQPIVIVDAKLFERLKRDLDPSLQKPSNLYIGIDIIDKAKLPDANGIFNAMQLPEDLTNDSQLNILNVQKQTTGLLVFIVGFLGLTFLITSGCILYFKQMDESEDEKPSYTILRKLGFTQNDLLKGIQLKQLFNFGIPLAVGLVHSYFAVQSGWFLFGTELWTPMTVVMVFYTLLYSIFSILSVIHYKKVIHESL